MRMQAELINCIDSQPQSCQMHIERQPVLFSSCNVELETSKRFNHKNYTLYSPKFRKVRKRIETLFSWLCDQFLLKRNYKKTLIGSLLLY